MLAKELDVISVLRSLRMQKIIEKATLTKHQRMLIKFQQKYMISDECSGESDDTHQLQELIESGLPLDRLIAIKDIKDSLGSYKKDADI